MRSRRNPAPAPLALACAAASLLAPSLGLAQATGWALDRYEPSFAGDVMFAADHPWYSRSRLVSFRANEALDYALRPLVVRRDGERVESIIDHMLVAHLQAGVAIGSRFGVALSLPLVLLQDGPGTNMTGGQLAPGGSFVPGDPRLQARVRVFGDADRDAISLHVGGQLFLGVGLSARVDNATDEALRGRLQVTAAGRLGWLRWSLSLGAHLRPTVLAGLNGGAGAGAGSEALIVGGLQYVSRNNRFMVGPEFWLSSDFDHFVEYKYSQGELLVGARYIFGRNFGLGLGVGPGLSQGAGTPALRALLSVAYIPLEEEPEAAPGDRDRDGFLDPNDVCPDVPAGLHPDPHRDGCPSEDRDHDGVWDYEDLCPDVPQGDHPDPSRLGCPDEDTDGDGIFNAQDQCRDVPQGPHPDPARLGCPDTDTDHDGVFDAQDQCREVPQGLRPDPQRIGCPMPDRDGDLVPDSTDHCPDQRGSPSPDPLRNGCPGDVDITGGTLRILRPVFFATNRDTILPRSTPVLQAVAHALAELPTIRRVDIEGHTDDRGEDAANLDLSQRRAASVVRWLTEHGIDASRLESHGYGESRPITTNTTVQGRGTNRRVVFRIVDPPMPTDAIPAGDASPGTVSPSEDRSTRPHRAPRP